MKYVLMALLLFSQPAYAPAQEQEEVLECPLTFNHRDMGIRPCLVEQKEGVLYAVFFSEDGTRVDLMLIKDEEGVYIFYVSKELERDATSMWV